MTRPEYVNGGAEPSNETWQEACAISQQWADGARLAAHKRHMRRFWLITALQWTLLILAILLMLLITDTIHP
jgi:hypothetical protein